MNPREYWGLSQAYAEVYAPQEIDEEFVTEDPVQDFRDMRRSKENAAGLRGSELSNSARPAGSAAQKPQPRSREFEKVLPSGSKPKPSGGGSAAMRSTGPSSPGYDTRRLGGSDLRRLSNSYDMFDFVKGHLLDEGYADTEDAAIAIMANMSEEWRESILESGYFPTPESRRADEAKYGLRGQTVKPRTVQTQAASKMKPTLTK